ncbi:hypothetical protein P7K49_040717, partial [Saguinus oedipus]
MLCLRELGLFEYLLHCPAQLGGSLFTICLLAWVRPATTKLRSTVVRYALLVVSLLWLVTSATSGCVRSG